MPNFKLTLCYDGSRYKGWQKQGNTENTIQAKLEALLSRLLEQPVELQGSGRTDAGVHALAQVCSFKAETKTEPDSLLKEIRRYLPEDIGALELEYAAPRFHARLSCREKSYVYRIWNSEKPNVFGRKYSLTVPQSLDLQAMEKAAALLCGEHDFISFCSNRHMKKSSVRTLRSAELFQKGEVLSIRFTGDGFLYNMVRIMVGTLLEVGLHKRNAEDVPRILAARDRTAAGFTAPAQGLFLEKVSY